MTDTKLVDVLREADLLLAEYQKWQAFGTKTFDRVAEVRKLLAAHDAPPTPAQDADVYAELDRAIKKFRVWPTDPLHAIAVVGEEFGELVQATLQHVYEPNKSTLHDVYTEAVQTAAMALRFVRSVSRYRFLRGEQHLQEAAPPRGTD